MKRPFADKRPIGPFTQLDYPVEPTGLIEIMIVPYDNEFMISPVELETILREEGIEGDVLEDSLGQYTVKIREDIDIISLQNFLDEIENRMSFDPNRSIMIAPT